MYEITLGIDFGTSNSAAAVLVNGAPYRLLVEGGEDTLPTAVFFDNRGGMKIGRAAQAALIAGDEGRYMRALKSVLGTPLLRETRLIAGKRRTLLDIITLFLERLRKAAEDQFGQPVTRALSGRPVHFHSRDAAMDAQAEIDLRDAYLAAGFTHVAFLPEPEAAALAAHGLSEAGQIGLIVDIGGGTSDFSLFRSTQGRADILSSHGIRLGGTNFDHAVSLRHAMPLLGYGGQVRREMGKGLLPIPNTLFNDLATWEKIPFLYTRETMRLVEDLESLAVEPEKLGRLVEVIEAELGHEIAFAVERGKIAVNKAGQGKIDLSVVEKRLAADVDRAGLEGALAAHRADLVEAVRETLTRASLAPEAVGSVVFVGGSSLMSVVPEAVRAVLPDAQHEFSEVMTAVVDGLALATAQSATQHA
ncbi:Chaperone protein DnaK [Aquimixticola soesokkakensis]|uniref:Chaperone protein DnaK n=1 Tax=Aquimixticola soesokkakensis TaxID=1519096 RepID=A0A1Y5S6Y8_9RHOB|nr:Hsp70 family protein [Aquimixticola soesokkakensis]SLN33380.1 Chaperone protein DnaK [Aquimixticola soesokkakensis]